MKTFANSLRSETGKFIFLGAFVVLALLSRKSPVYSIAFVVYGIWMFRRSRVLFLLGLIVSIVIFWRMVVSYPLVLESDRCTIEGVVTKVENDKVHFRSDTKYLLYFDERPSLIPGDKLRIRGRFFNVEEKDIPHAFSYSSYLRSSGFHGAFAVEEHTKIEHNFHLGQINHSVKSYIGLAFDEPVRKYIMMLAIGDDSLLESETAAQAQELGISHLFAISGMHVGLLFGAIGSLLKRLYLQLSTYRVLLIFFMIAYNLITGFRVSIIRASILMGTIQLMNEKSNSLSRLDVLALTMLALLVMNPFYLESLGFVLSFLVSIVLILGRNYLKSQNFLIRLVKLTLLANLFSLPLILETNGSFGLMTLPANVLFIVLVEFVMLPGAFLTLILPILEPLYCLVIGIFEFFLHIFESINLPLLMNLADPLSKSLFYLLLLVFFLNTHGNKRRSRAVLGILLLLTFNLSGFSLSTQVYLLDVGDGDSLFIRTPTSKVLIDTGSQDAYDTLAGFLRAENVHRLDCLVITHWHEDHYGEIGDILAIVDVQRIIANRDPEFNIGNLRVEVPKSGTNLVCGNLKFAVLHGNTGNVNENENSLVLSTTIGNDRWLLLADAEALAEGEVTERLSGPVDVVKVAHHGSLTSSSADLVEKTQSVWALISVGKNNYGHPSPEVLALWKRSGSKVLRTDRDGTIEFNYFCDFLKIIQIHDNKRSWYQKILCLGFS